MTLSAEQLEARSQLARWISGTLAGASGTPLPDLMQTGVDLIPTAERELRGGRPGDGGIEAERVRLFVNAAGGVPAAPYGSWWVEGTLEGRTTERVVAHYLREGLQIEAHSGPADYLPTELEFLSFLLHHQRAARITDAPDLERRSRERERDFIESEMLGWVPRFCRSGREATGEPFWTAVFDLIEAFVEGEAARLRGAEPIDDPVGR